LPLGTPLPLPFFPKDPAVFPKNSAVQLLELRPTRGADGLVMQLDGDARAAQLDHGAHGVGGVEAVGLVGSGNSGTIRSGNSGTRRGIEAEAR
jgi:hypothetical protein